MTKYEIHITIKLHNSHDAIRFMDFCKNQQIKGLLLNYDNGPIVQDAMTSYVVETLNPNDMYKSVNDMVLKIDKQFEVVRLKIEIPGYQALSPIYLDQICLDGNYFECHFDIQIPEYNMLPLTKFCNEMKMFISFNINKQSSNLTPICTLRTMDSLRVFNSKVYIISRLLSKFGTVKSQHVEYALFDSNINWDDQWLKVG